MAYAKGRKKVRKPFKSIIPSMEEALFLEQARAYFPEMKEVGKNAPF